MKENVQKKACWSLSVYAFFFKHWLPDVGKQGTPLANEENHNSLIYAYEDLMNTRTTNMSTTRAAARGDPCTIIYAKTSAYHNSFYQEPSANQKPTTLIPKFLLISNKFSLLLLLLLQSIALLL